MTFRILSLLRYVADIGKSSPYPIFFYPIKTDKREACVLYHTSWKIAKIITYMVNVDVFVIET